jgi:hypothetical protein
MQGKTNPIKVGTFQIGDKSTIGHVVLDGKNTKVHLSSNEFYHFSKKEESRIHGTFTDHEKITLIDCVSAAAPGSTSTANGNSYHASVFPHYVVTGERHIEPAEAVIGAIEITLEGAHILFWGRAFGASLHNSEKNREFLRQLTAHEEKPPEIGEAPSLFYFAGQRDLISVQTSIGKIIAAHCPTFYSPSSEGLRVENRIPFRIEFETPLTFEDAVNRAYVLVMFTDVLMGAEQCVETLTVELAVESEDKPRLKVCQSMAPQPSMGQELERPHPGDILIRGGFNPEELSAVLASWLSRHSSWRDARVRFVQSFRKQNSYTVDRLVAAANLFDIIPLDSVGTPPSISAELATAVEGARQLFKPLPKSPERDSVLGALGRIGNHNLRTKVAHRAKFLTDKIASKFEDLELVISAAVSARNFYVHGSIGKLSPEHCYELSIFFTDTLEFIFAASDLVEAGWDIEKWNSYGITMSHPFGRYRVGYAENVANLRGKLSAHS